MIALLTLLLVSTTGADAADAVGFCSLSARQGEMVTSGWKDGGKETSAEACKDWCGRQPELADAATRCELEEKLIAETKAPAIAEEKLKVCEITRHEGEVQNHYLKGVTTRSFCELKCRRWEGTTKYWGISCKWNGESLMETQAPNWCSLILKTSIKGEEREKYKNIGKDLSVADCQAGCRDEAKKKTGPVKACRRNGRDIPFASN